MHCSKGREDIKTLLQKGKSLKRADLLAVPSIKANPISILIINKYSQEGKVDFGKLIENLNAFVASDSLDVKLKFLFDFYDSNGDGMLSNLELFDMLMYLNKGILSANKVQNIVDKTFAEVGDYQSQMCFDEFKKLLVNKNRNIHELFGCIN